MKRAEAAQTPSTYEEFHGSALWKAIEKGIADLVRNEDIKERTPRTYIVGYLCKVIDSASTAGPKRQSARNSR